MNQWQIERNRDYDWVVVNYKVDKGFTCDTEEGALWLKQRLELIDWVKSKNPALGGV
jgi:hypothetical protein